MRLAKAKIVQGVRSNLCREPAARPRKKRQKNFGGPALVVGRSPSIGCPFGLIKDKPCAVAESSQARCCA